MSVCNDISDYHWLTGDEAEVMLNELAASALPLHTAVGRLRRHLSPERTHLVAELVELRRRAAAKFSNAERMFFTRTTLEQATDENIARYKAFRICQRTGSINARCTSPIADLCCGIGGDLLSLAEQGTVIAVDRNPIVAHLASANMRAVVPSSDVQFHTIDVADMNLDDVDAWHIDPDRRANSRRITSLEFCQPDAAAMERLLRRVQHAVIKLAPATKVPDAWNEDCELEWISRGGECRQQLAWHGNLAESPGQHRATILTAARGLAARTLVGTPNDSTPIAPRLSQYIFDVDSAVLAARLKGTLAAMHNLQALDTGPTYLTGDTPIADAALTCFQVDDILPLRPQSVAKYLRGRHVGQLEIKKRGVDVVPEKLRRELKLRGDNAATLIIAKVAGRPTAISAHRSA
jgi:predicted RNA methylase